MYNRHLQRTSRRTTSPQCEANRKRDLEERNTYSPGDREESRCPLTKRRRSIREDPGSSSVRSTKRHQYILYPDERAAFYTLFEDDVIRAFLAQDTCLKISDKVFIVYGVTEGQTDR
ncbi:uncharacterized protein O3C94_018563 [Discoglossus pictus]